MLSFRYSGGRFKQVDKSAAARQPGDERPVVQVSVKVKPTKAQGKHADPLEGPIDPKEP
jgi:hypothetical protein